MTRQEALDFLKENTLTNLRLALLEPDSNKPCIQAILKTVDGENYIQFVPYKFVDEYGGIHYPSPDTVQALFVATAEHFGVRVELFGDPAFVRDEASDNWIGRVHKWGYIP